jgi:hypothetical protein
MLGVGREAESKVLPRPRWPCHLAVTTLVAEPPRLLRTVMFCGLVAQVNSPRYLPPPSLVSVPICWPVEVT